MVVLEYFIATDFEMQSLKGAEISDFLFPSFLYRVTNTLISKSVLCSGFFATLRMKRGGNSDFSSFAVKSSALLK